ncbi:hypothetical protein JCM16303_004725 [Sporobolomyces ruberrimus]
MERMSSPARSARSLSSNLIRPYTTSSELSASDQLAAIAKAREERSKAREGPGRFDLDPEQVENIQTLDVAPKIQVKEVEEEQELVNDTSTKSLNSTNSRASPVPKLRVQPTSDRSFSPSIPSSPSRSSGKHAGASALSISETRFSEAIPRIPSPPESTFSIAEIPPFRPRSISPSSSDHSRSSIRTSSPTNVVLSGGLLDRLKAQRAAQVAKTASDPVSPPASTHDAPPSARETATVLATSSPSSSLKDDVPAVPLDEPARVASPSVASPSVAAPYSPDRSFSPTQSVSASLPPLTSTSTTPSSFDTLIRDDDNEGEDAVSELSQVVSNRDKSQSRSKIFGRYGEEIEYEFTALSDVQERSERSSMSTMRGSLWRANLRQLSLPASSVPSVSTSNRASYATSSIPSSKPVASHRHPGSSATPGEPERRVDATARLLGRSSSNSNSIFDMARISSRSSSTLSLDLSAPSSPTRNTSPEILRRASRFESLPSPTKPISTSDRSAIISFAPLDVAVDQGLSTEDSIEEIERRRTARRARLDSIRDLYATRMEASSEGDVVEENHWDEIERREQSQADAEYSASTLASEAWAQDHELPKRVLPSSLTQAQPPYYEGYLSVPTAFAGPEQPRLRQWISYYSVLTSETLSFRPTDQNSLKQPITVLDIAQCERVEERSPQTAQEFPRPFTVVLKSGERRDFRCEKGSERIRWILALETAIRANRSRDPEKMLPVIPSSRTSTPLAQHPASANTHQPDTRVSRSLLHHENSELAHASSLAFAPAGPAQRYGVVQGKNRQERSIWSELDVPPETSSMVASSQESWNKQENRGPGWSIRVEPDVHPSPLSPELLARYDRRPLPIPAQIAPSSIYDTQTTSPPVLRAFRTPDNEPPHRPSPTRPSSFHERFETERHVGSSLYSSRSCPSDSTITSHEARSSIRDPSASSTIPPHEEFHPEEVPMRAGRDLGFRRFSREDDERNPQAGARRELASSYSGTFPPALFCRAKSVTMSNSDDGTRQPSTAKSGFRLPLGKKKPATFLNSPVPERTLQHPTQLRSDPFGKSTVVQPPAPTLASNIDTTRSKSLSSQSSSLGRSEVEELLEKIRDGIQDQRSTLQEDKARQEMQAQAISALAHWITEDTHIRQAQYDALGQAVETVVQHVANLPQQLLTVLQTTASLEPLEDEPLDDDRTILGKEDETEGKEGEEDQNETTSNGRARLTKKNSGKSFGINPLSSFAKANRQALASRERSFSKTDAAKPKGPRMPGIRVWGAPDPVDDRSGRWGDRRDPHDTMAEPEFDGVVDGEANAGRARGADDVESAKNAHREADLSALADRGHGDIEESTLSRTVLEILEKHRELDRKQTEQATRSANEGAKARTLSNEELAELENQRAEIARIEQITSMSADRTAKINEAVTRLAAKSDKTDALLAEIVKGVKEGRTATMDPALSGEVKKLLGCVKSGVDAHVLDFRGKLTSEVQRMFKEVGKLRDEKKSLQSEIADLMAFQAKYGGMSGAQRREEPQVATQDLQPEPDLKSSSFYGPRRMR